MAESKTTDSTVPPDDKDKGDLSDLEGKVLDEEQEITQPAATHEDILAAERMRRDEHNIEVLVQTRAGDRRIATGYTPPADGSYVLLTESLWPDTIRFEDHRGHATQVAQTRAYGGGEPPLVTFRCDCGAEFTVPFNDDVAHAIAHPSEEDFKTLREIPEEYRETTTEVPRSDGDPEQR